MNAPVTSFILTLLCAVSFASCAGGGAPYAELKSSGTLSPSTGKGRVIVYRTSGLAGKASKPFVWVNDVKFAQRLARGGFYSYDAMPGPLLVEFAWHDHYSSPAETAGIALTSGLIGVGMDHLMGHKRKGLTLQVPPNQTCYVLFDGRKLSQVSKEEAEGDLEHCGLLNPSGR
ncbi:hypothetical protein [Prosthecobacter sp.]|uniref:hypothetical protein n=1 Tax=Prosthecobacter sp. TaxID=1965333 RepID=UPI003782D2F4